MRSRSMQPVSGSRNPRHRRLSNAFQIVVNPAGIELSAATSVCGSALADFSGPFCRLLSCFCLLALSETTEYDETGSGMEFGELGGGLLPPLKEWPGLCCFICRLLRIFSLKISREPKRISNVSITQYLRIVYI